MTRAPILTGPRITLRPPQPGYAAERAAFGRDPEIARMFGILLPTPEPMSHDEAEDWLESLRLKEPGWVIEVQGQLAGSAFLHGYDAHDRRARIALGFLAPKLLGRGLGREAIRLVLSHGFGAMGLHRVDLRVLAFNERALRCYRACGFTEEGREREAARVGHEWVDDIIMSILAHEFRALPGQNS